MKMVKAIVRPEKETEVVEALAKAGFAALTKWDVLGRGRQKGIQVGATVYGELAKSCLLVVVKDDDVPRVVEAVTTAARTGHPGDGRIFVSEVATSYTIRTGKAEA
jgi:nitrogen regulatory protein PII 1